MAHCRDRGRHCRALHTAPVANEKNYRDETSARQYPESLRPRRRLAEDDHPRIECTGRPRGVADIVIVASIFVENVDVSFELADQLIDNRSLNIEALLIPEAHAFRSDGRFNDLIKKVGLYDYWENTRWPAARKPLSWTGRGIGFRTNDGRPSANRRIDRPHVLQQAQCSDT